MQIHLVKNGYVKFQLIIAIWENNFSSISDNLAAKWAGERVGKREETSRRTETSEMINGTERSDLALFPGKFLPNSASAFRLPGGLPSPTASIFGGVQPSDSKFAVNRRQFRRRSEKKEREAKLINE
ncbi:hypothetical protein niasHT_026193 [Heterodera trifolii]|uniref:Uncharacterized protein n=1 Tax=Heterodera trifolii TaxID=157864 RepID=A0ABD2K1P8_9BILA